MNQRFVLFLTVVLALGSLGMSKRAPKHIVSFHVQTDPDFVSSRRVFEWPVGSGLYYEKTPSIHHKQIRSFSAFDGDDGGWGAVFRLTVGGRNALHAVSQAYPGKYLLAIVQGEPRSVTKIDRFNDDGQIVIWEKLKPEDMEVFDKKFSQFE